MITIDRVPIECKDGQLISGTLYCPESSLRPEYVVVVVPGVGIPAKYYDGLARWFAGAGHPTLTFDYRGIGESRTGSLKGCSASFYDWGSKDCAGALKAAKTMYPASAVAAVAHSFGSFLVGCADIPDSVLAAIVVLGPHTGFPGDYRRRAKPLMLFAWHMVMPAVARLLGYFPGRLAGLPSNLPLRIALQWAGRCRHADIWENIGGEASEVGYGDSLRKRMESLRVPILGLRAVDDAFSTEAGARRLLSCYRCAASQMVSIEPKTYGIRRLGHMRYLSSKIATTWSQMEGWLSDAISRSNCKGPIGGDETYPVLPP